jgi:hypothetical protein
MLDPMRAERVRSKRRTFRLKRRNEPPKAYREKIAYRRRVGLDAGGSSCPATIADAFA